MVDLTKIDLATQEDRHYQIDCWAALFKAETWEEIRMLASKNEYIKEAAETIFKFNTDAQIRKQCLDREEYYQDLRNYERVILEKDNSISKYEKVIEEKDNTIAEKEAELAAIKEELSRVNAKLDEIKAQK